MFVSNYQFKVKLLSLFKTLKFISNHPLNKRNKYLAIKKYFYWQISCLFNDYPIVFPLLGETKMIASKGLVGATGNLYCGLDEFLDMGFLLHFLRSEDIFIDIGANVGSYTLLASGNTYCNSISIEPIPETFETLKSNILLNDLVSKVRLLNIGLGSKRGVLRFTRNLDSVNHVAI